MPALTRRITRFTALACVALLATGCAQGRAGTALPDGDQAANYVTEKFRTKLEGLKGEFSGDKSRKARLESFARIGEKNANTTLDSVQFGSPPSRFVQLRSNKDAGDFREFLHPAGDPLDYMHLGPVYSSLASTPWVSREYTGGNLIECYWNGMIDACKLVASVESSVKEGSGKAAKRAKSLPDGGVELVADVPLRVFIKERVVVFPESLASKITEEQKGKTFPTTVVLNADGGLVRVEMVGVIPGPSEVEVRIKYENLGPATARDIPKKPDAAQITHLPDRAAVDEFHRKLGEITGG
ncbi:hypothetical protein [Amycolatopsis suaedae]|uniref:Lipoprotein n=1 Tax=Amycolatopsis suaedae TaxID=2510978 RepID=A0A4V2EM75_9PSEU|nr:hypothetical protein [Amycolatopsis suaedae]RZQ64085.1 hypothetical protein EWH70_08795 [Amycolatopsis suaedae]